MTTQAENTTQETTVIEKIRWNDLTNGGTHKGKYAPGRLQVSLHPAMFNPDGYEQMFEDKKNEQKFIVVYDKNYVLSKLLRMLSDLTIIDIDGNIDSNLFDFLIKELKEYAIKEQENKKDEFLKQEAQRLAKNLPYCSYEQWLEILKKQQQQTKETPTVSNHSKGNNKTK